MALCAVIRRMVRMERWLLRVLTVSLLAASAACRHAGPDLPSRPLDTSGAAFVGIIYDVRQSMIMADEESAQRGIGVRRGEIWISPSTEIVSRTGMLVPWENLRRGMRVRVWFTNDFTETGTTVQGRARRIIADY